MLPRTLYGSHCVLHYIHSSCPQRHVSLPLAQVLSVEASIVLCRAAEWETTQLSTHDHVDQGPHKQKNKQNTLSKQRKVRAMHPQHVLTSTKQKRFCVYCPHGSLKLAFHQYDAQQFLFGRISLQSLQDTKLSCSKNVCLAAWLTLPTVSDTISKS